MVRTSAIFVYMLRHKGAKQSRLNNKRVKVINPGRHIWFGFTSSRRKGL